jgi:hypothetical protein
MVVGLSTNQHRRNLLRKMAGSVVLRERMMVGLMALGMAANQGVKVYPGARIQLIQKIKGARRVKIVKSPAL